MFVFAIMIQTCLKIYQGEKGVGSGREDGLVDG